MAHYHRQIKRIKDLGPVDCIRFKYGNKFATMRLVDDSDETVDLLTRWRENNRFMFGTNFLMSRERTQSWIRKKLEDTDWILFMISIDGGKYGNMGADLYKEENNSAILDNIMKEPSAGYPGLMTMAEKVCLRWMFDGLKLSKIYGDLFSDNYKMMNLHYKCGWRIADAVPLKRVYTGDGWRWEKTELKPDEYGERYFWHLEITREQLLEKFGSMEYEILC